MKLDRHIVRLLARLPLPQDRLTALRLLIAEWLDRHTLLCRAWLITWAQGLVPWHKVRACGQCNGDGRGHVFCGKCWYLGICGYDQSPAPPEDMGGEYGGGYPPKDEAAAAVAANQEGVES